MPQSLPNFLWVLFYPSALLWSFVTLLRRKIFFSRGYQSRFPVLCVGNLHSGGSSKTPVVIELIKFLRDKNPIVVSRGFGRSSRASIQELELSSQNGAEVFGDEPWMIANEAKCPVWIGKNRGEVAKAIERKVKDAVLIMDDGYQNFTLKKDLSVICIQTDKKLPESNAIPLGELRESLLALKSADAVVLVKGKEEVGFQLWWEFLGNELDSMRTFKAETRYESDSDLAKGKWIGFCGIAGPERFRATLEALRCDHELVIFADHHCYSPANIRRLLELKETHESVGFVTTSKDYYKVAALFEAFNEKVAVVKMEIEFEESFRRFITDRTKSM